MAILAFQKPDKVLMLEADNFFGKFEFRPLEPGYGVTVGNALRRIPLLARRLCDYVDSYRRGKTLVFYDSRCNRGRDECDSEP